tara:strand:+ start:128 stop:511 length:384 start_codon:yes stop_codon:yes gene_type:complete
MQVSYATEYEERTVIGVCLNPDDPAIVHEIGAQSLDSTGQKMIDADGAPVLITSAECEPGCTLASCFNARQNHDIREFLFDGEERFKMDESGNRTRKVLADLLVEIRPKLAPPEPPINNENWIGQEV